MWLRLFIFTMVLQSLLMAKAGDPDTTFGTDGMVITEVGSSADRAYSTVIQSDGKIVAAGHSYNGNDWDFALARYDSNGTLDTTFGTNGKVTTDVVYDDYGYSVAIQNDGKIVVAGYSKTYNGDFALVRYDSNGSLDTTFGGDGKVVTDMLGQDDRAHSVAIQDNGKIVVAGYSNKGGFKWDFALARYDTNGSLDTTFDGDGKVFTEVGGIAGYARSIAIQDNGKIVVAGYNYDGGIEHDFALVRYNDNGSLDTTFGGDGKVITDLGGNGDQAYSVVIQDDGKIVVAGYSNKGGSGSDFALVRYNSNGILDTTFDGDGKVTTDVAYDDYGYSVAIQSDGKIVVTGYSSYGYGNDIALVRYNTNGSLDTTFGDDGRVIKDVGDDDSIRGYSVAIQSDSKIVVTGYSDIGGSDDFALLRYHGKTVTLAPIYYLLQ